MAMAFLEKKAGGPLQNGKAHYIKNCHVAGFGTCRQGGCEPGQMGNQAALSKQLGCQSFRSQRRDFFVFEITGDFVDKSINLLIIKY